MTNLAFEPKAAEPKIITESIRGVQERLLDEKYFGLDRYLHCRQMILTPDERRFSLLTAIEAGAIACEGREFRMPAGQTALIPAVCGPVGLSGGHFLNAFPAV